MKIAIPVNEEVMETDICQSFGRAPYYLIFDTDTKVGEFIENTAANSQGGAGIKAAQIIVDSNVDALLTPRCGENAAQVIKAANIKMYKTESDSVESNINALINNDLSLLDNIHEGFHNRGGR